MKTILKNHNREDVVKLLNKDAQDLVGVELGVAEGIYSHRMLTCGLFKHFYGVDSYDDIDRQHNIDQYKKTLLKMGLTSSYKLLRMRFDDALDLFDDNTLDFIYVDGYAHTGEEGGKTICDWWKKLKVGGVMAGDDYDEKAWPLVVAVVDNFVKQIDGELFITDLTEDNPYCQYPSWGVVKKESAYVETDTDLQKLCKTAVKQKDISEKQRYKRKKNKYNVIILILVLIILFQLFT